MTLAYQPYTPTGQKGGGVSPYNTLPSPGGPSGQYTPPPTPGGKGGRTDAQAANNVNPQTTGGGSTGGGITGLFNQLSKTAGNSTGDGVVTGSSTPPAATPNGFEVGLGAMDGGMDFFRNAMNYQAPQIGGNYHYNPQQAAGIDGQSYLGRLGNASADQMSAIANAAGQSYQADQLANRDLSQYMNPYTDSVIDSAMNDLDRGRQQALNSTGAAATAGGAFGGDRHGIMEAQNNRDYMDQVARTSSNLRNQAYMNAQGAAMGDVNAMNQARMTNAGMGQQAMLANQAAQNAANAQNAQMGTQTNMQNAASRNAMLGQLAQLEQQNSQFNSSAMNNARQFNTGMNFNRDSFNANQQQQQFANQANAANALYGMGNDRYKMTDAALGNMGQIGSMVDAINNAYLQQGAGMFDANARFPFEQFQLALGPLGSMQSGQTQTYNPGKMDYLGLGTQLGSAAIMASDAGLKDNLRRVAKINGFQLYTWEWNERAVELGCGNDATFGVVAQEVRELRPEAVIEGPDGYLMVDYRKLPEIARTVAMGGQ